MEIIERASACYEQAVEEFGHEPGVPLALVVGASVVVTMAQELVERVLECGMDPMCALKVLASLVTT